MSKLHDCARLTLLTSGFVTEFPISGTEQTINTYVTMCFNVSARTSVYSRARATPALAAVTPEDAEVPLHSSHQTMKWPAAQH